MMSEKDNKSGEEINIYEIILTIWHNKWKFLLSILLPVLIMIVYLSNQTPPLQTFNAITKIEKNSNSNQIKYQTFNDFLNFIQPNDTVHQIESEEVTLRIDDWKFNFFEYVNYQLITKEYLLQLFLDKINDSQFLSSLIKKNDLLNRQDFGNSEEYDNAVFNLINSIEFPRNIKQDLFVESNITKKKDWENLLSLIEKSINLEIQNELKENFYKLISNKTYFKKYTINKIDKEISYKESINKSTNYLQNEKRRLLESKNLEELEKLFIKTPIFSNEFYAANLSIIGTRYIKSNDNKKSKKSLILLAGLLGGFFGMILIVIIEKNKK